MVRTSFPILLISFAFILAPPAEAKNFHPIDERPATEAPGKTFGIYRTGTPSYADYEDMVCNQGITEILVMSNTSSVEQGFNDAGGAKKCRGKKITLKILPDPKNPSPPQNVRKRPLDVKFLEAFDRWVADAQKTGKKIAFRCNCGCHRTGRLAAYYEMNYMKRTPKQVMDNMYKLAHGGEGKVGKFFYWWVVKRPLKKQVQALYDYIQGQKCSTKKKFCVDMSPAAGNATELLATEPDPDDLPNGYANVSSEGDEDDDTVSASTDADTVSLSEKKLGESGVSVAPAPPATRAPAATSGVSH